MKTIKMPGFTAEASLSQTRKHYQLATCWPNVTGGQAIIAQRIKIREVRCECDTHTDICVCTNGRVFHLLLGDIAVQIS
ncbi:MAG: hypothetical protein F9K48_08600 [Candidatus Brocadia sp.]|nr:MAG: hypothetical protein F9K48_08600 [Candidatus Brocadia sp.]